ncbi:MAG: hypothetical protein E7451_07545 [Ruminococcaceae bacterium]|nr:hypothetical protein [Oscillospiraceae bacterium]
MKKLICLLLCALLLTSCVQSYDGPTETVRVLSETATTHYFRDFGTESFTQRTVYAYDIYGNAAQELSYTNDEVTHKTTRTYDPAGNLLDERLYSRDGWFWKRSYRIESEYDDRSLLTSRTVHSSRTYTYTYTYDELGRPLTEDLDGSIRVCVYDDQGYTETLTHDTGDIVVSRYDADGFLLRKEHTGADGTHWLQEYTRRSDGQVETARTYENGVLTASEAYTYDDQGRPTRHTVEGQSPSVTRWEYGEQQRTIYQPDGTYTVTGYDEDGSPLFEDLYHENGELWHHTVYTYRDIQVPAKEETP